MQNNPQMPSFYFIMPFQPIYQPLNTQQALNHLYSPYCPSINSYHAQQVQPQNAESFSPNIPRNDSKSNENLSKTIRKRPKLDDRPPEKFSQFRAVTSRKKKTQVQKIIETQWDRNLASNVLKIYLKYLHHDIMEHQGYTHRLVDSLGVKYTKQKFLKHLQEHLSQKLNYIRPELLRRICLNQKYAYDPMFSMVIRVSIKQFFRTQIFMVNCTRKKSKRIIRNEHIQAGAKILKHIMTRKDDEQVQKQRES